MQNVSAIGVETKEQIIVRQKNAVELPNEVMRDRITIFNRNTEQKILSTPGMMVFVDDETARRANSRMGTIKQDPTQRPWEFRVLQEQVPGTGYRSVHSLDSIHTIGLLKLAIVQKDSTGRHFAQKEIIGNVNVNAELGMHAVILRDKTEYAHDGHWREVLITSALTETQSNAVTRLMKSGAI